MNKTIYRYICLFLILFSLYGCAQEYNSWFSVGRTADTEDPVIYVTAPQNADCVPGRFEIKGYITDDRGVDHIDISYTDLSGDKIVQTVYTTRDFSVTFDLYSANVESGDLAFLLTAYDKAGHSSRSDLSVTLDKSSPVITLFEPNDGGTGVVTNPLIGAVSFTGMVSDDYSLNFASVNNVMKIYKVSDEQTPIMTRLLTETPFILKNLMNTMDASHDVGDYIAEFSFEDVNGNVGSKRVRFTTAKGDKTTKITIDSPLPDYLSSDSLTLSGSATNQFLDIIKVQYVISERSSNQPVVAEATEVLQLGQAGSFSAIISLKALGIDAGQYNLRVTALASDGSLAEQVVPFEFNKDLVNYDFIDTSESSWIPGRTPNASSYIKEDFYVEIAATSSLLTDADYCIIRNGVTYQDWTSMLSDMDTTTDASGNTYYVFSKKVILSELIHDMPDGSFNIQTRVRQTETGQWRPMTRVVNTDRTPPSLEISSPIVTTNVNGALVISGSSSDNMGLQSVKIREDNGTDTSFHDTDGSLSLWSYTVAEDDRESDIPIEEKYGVGPGQTKNVSFTVSASDLAGNTVNKVISITISYDADTPVLSFLMPESDNIKYSGTLTMNATIADDDYPRKGMNASMNVYKYKSGKDSPSDYQNETPIEAKQFTEEMINNNSNLSHALNLDQDKYEDLTKYVIVLTGHGWKNRDALPVMRTFITDKSVPTVDVSADNEYVTHQIHFTGYVRYKVGSALDSENPCILQYTNTLGNNVTSKVELADAIEEVVGSVHYYKRTFDVTLNSNGTHTGFVSGSEPTVTWGDDSWGNSTKLWTFRATSTTSLQGWKTARVYLDNHKPVVTITSPTDGFLFNEVGTQSFDLKFIVNDEPPVGSSYKLNFRDNVLVQYWLAGDSDWKTASNYGDGTSSPLQGVNTYNISFTSIPDALNHKIRLIVKDLAGNVSDAANLTFHKTTTPPSITDFAVENARPDGLYKGSITINIVSQDSHDASDDGLAKIELMMDGNVIDTKDLSASYPKNDVYSKTFDTTSWSDGTHVFTCRVTDKSGIVVYNSGSVGNIGITVDNTSPTVETSQLLSMGENATDIVATDKWTAYLGYRFTVSDNISLLNQNPTIKIGTTSGADDILADTTLQMSMSSISGYVSEFTNWIDMFDVLNVNYSTKSKVYVTISFSDAAGNTAEVIKEYSKGTLPTAAFSKAPGYAYSGANDVTIEGTYTGSVGKAWLRVGSSEWKTVTLNNGSWSVTLDNELFTSSGEYTMTLRVMSSDKTAQNIISCKYLVDIEVPTVAITSITAYSDETGHVSGDNLSGKVVINGTFNDDLADKLGVVSDAAIKLTIGSKSKTVSTITRNYNGTPWTWQLIWDTEDTSSGGFLTKVVQSGVTMNVSCQDYAGNTGSTSKSGLSVVPYITSVVGASSADKVYPVRYYKNSTWGNHADELRYSLAAGTSVTVQGYNLKQGTTSPTVKRGSAAVTVSSSSLHSITFNTASDWLSDAITVHVNSISALNKLYFNIWNFTSLTRSGHNDTLYAIGYDMVLLDDTVIVGGKTSNKVFTTFARNTKIPDYTDYDYCAFSFYENKTSAASRYTFNGGSSIVDPLFYASVAKISNDSFESIYTYDEWGVDASRIATFTKDDITTTNTYKATGPSNRADCVKSARMLYTGNTGKRIYLAGYDDESRQNSPTPEVWFGQAEASKDITMKSVGNCNGYFDLAAVTSTKYPVLVYGDSSGLRTAYVNSTSSSTLTGKLTVVTDGSMYCKIVSANAATTVHLVYQDSSNNLSYRRISGEKYLDASTKVMIECADTEIDGVKEGVTGYNTNIDISTSVKTKGSTTYASGSPHISYINNSLLNTITALRYARCKSATSISADDWEYMIVPSPVSVNDGSTYIRTDQSNNPVIMYKGDDRLYIARLAD